MFVTLLLKIFCQWLIPVALIPIAILKLIFFSKHSAALWAFTPISLKPFNNPYENVESTFVSNMENYDGNITFPNNFIYKKNGNDFELALDKKTKVSAKVDGLEEGDILIIKFDLDNVNTCSFGDVSISINDVVNVLTCKSWKYHNRNNTFHYVISQNEKIDKLDFVFSKGTFKVSNLEMYKINYKDIKNMYLSLILIRKRLKETL